MNVKVINFMKDKFWLNQLAVFVISGLVAYRYPVACIKGIIIFCIVQGILSQVIKTTEENKSLMMKYFLGFCASFFFAILVYEYFYGVTIVPEIDW